LAGPILFSDVVRHVTLGCKVVDKDGATTETSLVDKKVMFPVICQGWRPGNQVGKELYKEARDG
jgi:hypothetical protein